MILAISYFQQKLILPTLAMAVGIGFAGHFTVLPTPIVEAIGFGYIVAGPLTQYFIYDLKYPNEYYFYFNLGLGRHALYLLTVVLNALIGSSILLYG